MSIDHRRVHQEEIATIADRVNTVLQIDRDGNGFGERTPDVSDYVVAAQGDPSLLHGYLLT